MKENLIGKSFESMQVKEMGAAQEYKSSSCIATSISITCNTATGTSITLCMPPITTVRITATINT